MEGLSLLLKESKRDGKLMGVKVSIIIKILHLFFVDDVLIMTRATLQEWMEVDRLIKIFCKASGLQVNESKTTVLHAGLLEVDLIPLKILLPFNFAELSVGFNYLGYYLKTGPAQSGRLELVTGQSGKKNRPLV
jgi:hypothetical protein